MRPLLAFALLPAVLLAAADPLERAEAFSLFRAPGGQRLPGHFTMGFVRGEPLRTVQLGFSAAQDSSEAPAFVQGAPYPAPNIHLNSPLNPDYHSLALPVDSITGLLASAARAGRLSTTPTKAYGALAVAAGPDGKPLALPPTKTRPLAKTRDLTDLFDPATRRYLTDYAAAHVRSRVQSPANAFVARWGLDNEWEPPVVRSPAAAAGFLEWLRRAYNGDIAALNAAWGEAHARFDASVVQNLPDADGRAARPGAFLDWIEFQTGVFHDVLLGQAAAMRDADPLRRGVVLKTTQLTIEMPVTARARLLDHGRLAALLRPHSGGLYGIDMYGHGDRQAYGTNYIYNCIRPDATGAGHGVMLCETNNRGGPGHQFASTYWRLLPNGLKAAMFFTPGYVGAPEKTDWDTYAFLDRATGAPREKFFYAARWAAAVHRSEKFWTDAVPAAVPRVAMLLSERDVLLAEPRALKRGEGVFAHPSNNRWLIYRRLREQGFWVDVIPCEKLTAGFLANYQALLLAGAEHLSPGECEAITRFVADGGVLVADTNPGARDPHHRLQNALAGPLGAAVTRLEKTEFPVFKIQGRPFAARTQVAAAPVAARPVAQPDGAPPAFLNTFNKGRVLYLPFELGSLAPPAPAGARQVAAEDDGFAIGAWLAGLLARAGVRPAHAAVFAEAPDAARLLRVEQPFADADGNLAVVLSNRASVPREILPAGGVLDISLPGGPWQSALWSPAETNALEAIPVRQVAADLHRLNLPEIRSAGILYFFRKHPPLLAARITGARQVAVDPHTAKIAPGEAVTLEIALHNTTGGKLPPGNLRVAAPAGWSVSPETLPTPEIAAGGSLSARATLVPLAGAPHKPDWLHPVVTHWRDASGADRAVFATHAEIALSENDTPLLLSDNAGYPDTFPRLLKTGATYAYVRPADARADPIDKSGGKNGAALQNGFGSEGGERNSLRRGAPLKKHYARYASRVVEIVFDLHAVRDVMRVNVVAGPEAVPLKSVEIHTAGEDGVFTRQAAAGLKAPLPEVVLHTGRVPARRVRIRAEWPAPGGTLDEIEIWGR